MAASKSNQHVEKCHFCKGEIDPLNIPSICSFCRGMFCNQHKLPRAHACSYKHQKKPEVKAIEARVPAAQPAQSASAPAAAEMAKDRVQQEQNAPETYKSTDSSDSGQDVIKGVEGAGRWTLFKRRLFGGR